MLQRILRPLVDLREDEGVTALLMFAYSFLAMAGYNIVKPATRSQFIDSLGADNIPYVQLVAGMIMGFVIQAYTSAMRLLPRRWVFAATQAVMVGLLLVFWSLFKTEATWVSVAFYLWGVLAGSLLISQFWSLANDIYDARQAKRVFGFIGGGASLGGIIGAGFAGQYARTIGTNNLLLVAAVFLAVCGVIVSSIAMREKPAAADVPAGDEKGMSPREAVALLVKSKHFQIIALVISFAAIGAGIVEQQVNMAAAQYIPGKDGRTAFLANVIFYSSIAGFLIQMTLTSRLHRLLGIGFALLLLPITLGGTGVLMLATAALWSATTARVLDTSLRYTVDKTTREILFMPLPTAMKYRAKPFADVAVDRFAKGLGAALLIVAIKVAGVTWPQLSYLSITVAVLWIVMALRARREYLQSFRQSLESRVMEVKDLRIPGADLSTIETLVQELAQPDSARVVYAIDMLESLDKRNLVTPLLLYHEAPDVRRRALQAIGSVRRDIALNWLPQLRRMLSDADSGVRAAAIAAIGNINNEDAASLSRPLLADPDPRIRVTAAVALAASRSAADVDAAEAALVDLAGDSRSSSHTVRRDVAAAIRQIENPRFRRLLIPLLYDGAPDVAHEAMESVQAAGTADFIFVPTLVALLRNRQLKARARAVIVSYGEPVVDVLAHFLRDPDEDIWVRRHIPTSLSQIPSQKSVDVLVAALDEPDGFLRYKVIAALDRLRRTDMPLSFPRETLEIHALREGMHFFNYLSLFSNLLSAKSLQSQDLLTKTLEQKMERTKDRMYRLLSLIYPWRDIGAAQWTLAHGDARSRASASEYLDNILTGQVRKRLMPVLEDLPLEERVKRGNMLLKTRPRDLEETLLHLINDDDQVVAAVAIDVVRQNRLWTLGDDIEHVLAHRDVHDWYVFETASWALAERRMPADRRRELWLEPLPASEIAGRIRALALFGSVSVDELFRMASTARQVRHQSGTVLLQEGITPDTIHVLLDGHVVESGTTARPGTINAPSSFGFAQALQGTAMRKTVRTADTAVTLALTVDELNTLLADNTDLVRGFFATLAKRVEASTVSNLQSTGATTELRELAADGLLPVEKILALQRLPVFSRIAPDEMAALAATTETVVMKVGTPLFAESAPVALWVVLSGEVSLDDAGGGNPTVARTGDVIGSLSMLSGQPLGKTADVLRSGVVLRLERDDLFDLLGERPELLRQLFAGMFKVGAETAAPATV
ncbi:MAG TPA: Npt1/Npt2 family nucleotide transporter [Vicinamibacterales bacterium]|nr:Npt1/Npt2 family nucleotide transporter [Vicinamibacterales bacterium]